MTPDSTNDKHARPAPRSIASDWAAMPVFLLLLAIISLVYRGPELRVYLTAPAGGQPAIAQTPSAQQPGLTPIGGHSAMATRAASWSLAEVVSQSTLIVIGHCLEVGGVVNGARLPGDPSQPDPERFDIYQTYHIAVDGCLKGCGPQALRYVQAEGVIEGANADRSAEAIEAARRSQVVSPVRFGTRYLFFLKPAPFAKEYLMDTCFPSRWNLGDTYASAAASHSSGMLLRRPSADLLRDVGQLVAGVVPPLTPTPVPLATVGLEPTALHVSVGETFTVSLTLDTVVAVRGMDFGLSYDASVLRYDKATEGAFFSSWANHHQASTFVLGQPATTTGDAVLAINVPKIAIVVAGAGDTGPTDGPRGSGTVFTLRFAALADGVSSLSLTDVKVVATSGCQGRDDVCEIPVRAHDCEVTVVSGGE